MYRQFAKAYERIAIESAPPAQILDQLYSRLIQDLHDASECILARDIQGRAKAINHGFRILEAFQISLDQHAAPELCERLDSLYQFIAHQLTQATIENKIAPLQTAEKLIVELQSAFQQAAQPT